MFVWGLIIVISLWVFFDAKKRIVEQPFLWAIGTFLFSIFILPFYFAKRNLLTNEIREGGTAWNVIKYFEIYWTLIIVAVGFTYAGSLSSIFASSKSTAEQAGATIGATLGFGFIFGLWFAVSAVMLVIGLFLKKSSIVEKGPTEKLVSVANAAQE